MFLNGVSVFSTPIWLCPYICPLLPFSTLSFVLLLTLSVALYSCNCLVSPLPETTILAFYTLCHQDELQYLPWLAPLKLHHSLSSLYTPAQFSHLRNSHGLSKDKLHTILALSVIRKMEQHSQDLMSSVILLIFLPQRDKHYQQTSLPELRRAPKPSQNLNKWRQHTSVCKEWRGKHLKPVASHPRDRSKTCNPSIWLRGSTKCWCINISRWVAMPKPQ